MSIKNCHDFINKKVGTKTYIEIPNRLFLIGERVYGGWSRNLDTEDRLKLVKVLKSKNILCHLETIEEMFVDEEAGAGVNEPCNSRVIVKINDKDYTIQNYNIKCIKYETALKIASFLIKRGLDTDIEVIQGFKGSKIIKSISTSRSIKKKVESEQINMFSGKASDMSYIN